MSPHDGGSGVTKFPRNAWFMAAWSSEVGPDLFSRRLLDVPVLIYRLDGHLVACEDRCPHRFAPLSMGRKTATGVQCAYHGLHFDRTGLCDRNPSGGGHIPKGTHVRTFRLVERHRMLWIWMGDPDLADESQIPDFGAAPKAGAAAYDNLGNYLHVRANWMLELDNLMDLSHVNFIHDGNLGNETMRAADVRVIEKDGQVRAELWMPETTCGFGPKKGQPCDQWMHITWMSPAAMTLEFGAVSPGDDPVQDPNNIAFHIITPETDRTTHYFFGSSGSFDETQEDLAKFIREAQVTTFFMEDNPMLEAVDTQMDGADFWSLHPAILPNDKAAIRVRRKIEKMCREELL